MLTTGPCRCLETFRDHLPALLTVVDTLIATRNALQREVYPMAYKPDEIKTQQACMDALIFSINAALANLDQETP